MSKKYEVFFKNTPDQNEVGAGKLSTTKSTWRCFGIRSEWRRSGGFDKVAAVYNASRAQDGIFQSSDRKLGSRLGG